MFNPDFLLTLSATTPEIENANLFPFPFGLHLVFCAVALIFFGWRFYVQKKPFQVIFSIAIPLSLLIWLNDSKAWFYIIGLVELILILGALVSCFIFKDKVPEKTATDNPDSEADNNAGGAADAETNDEEEEDSSDSEENE